MRRALIATLSLALAWLAMPTAPVLAASGAKVVVVVGPAGGSTGTLTLVAKATDTKGGSNASTIRLVLE